MKGIALPDQVGWYTYGYDKAPILYGSRHLPRMEFNNFLTVIDSHSVTIAMLLILYIIFTGYFKNIIRKNGGISDWHAF